MALLSHSCQIVDKSSLPYRSEPQQKPSPAGHTQRSLRKASRQLEVKSVWVRDQAASPSREPLTLLATCASSILGCLCHLFPAAGIWVPPLPSIFHSGTLRSLQFLVCFNYLYSCRRLPSRQLFVPASAYSGLRMGSHPDLSPSQPLPLSLL